MSTGAVLLPPQQKSEKAGGLWNRLKKNLNLRDAGNGLVVQRRNPLEPRQIYENNMRRNRSEGDFMPSQYLQTCGNPSSVSIGSLGQKNSLKSVQLELAKCDHESNILNSKPMPKRIPPPEQQSQDARRKGGPTPSDCNGHRRQLRRAATMSTIGHPKLVRVGSDISYSTHSSENLPYCHSSASPVSGASRSPVDVAAMRSGSGKALWGKIRQRYAPTAHELGHAPPLPKLATFTELWDLIFEIVRENGLLDMDEPDPCQWWRKVFVNLRSRHGKAKASSIAEQLMQNPEMLSAIQTKLAGMVDAGGNSPMAHMRSLPKSVRRRVKALKRLQFNMVKLESKFYEEVHELECKYADMYAPILEERRAIVSGDVEPSDEQCDWPSDAEDEDEALVEEASDKLKIEASPDDGEDVKGVQGFWLVAFKNVELLASMIQEHDEPILEHLSNVKVNFSAQPMGFTLEFHFSPNEYFSNKILTKSYEMRSEPDEDDPFSFEGPEIVACQGCVINWNKGKNVTVRIIKKKQKHQKSGTTRTITKQEQQDSFFNFFSPPEAQEVDDEDLDEEAEALLQADYEIGHFIRERVVPRAVLYFTGEACDDDDYVDDDDDEDHEEDDDDDDPDFDPAAHNAGGKNECKQQ